MKTLFKDSFKKKAGYQLRLSNCQIYPEEDPEAYLQINTVIMNKEVSTELSLSQASDLNPTEKLVR